MENASRVNRFGLIVFVVSGLLSCARLSQDELVVSAYRFVNAPFQGFSITEADAASAAITGMGGSLNPARYSLGDGETFGVIDFANGSVTLHRADVSGPCTDGSLTAPGCGFTWGTGSNGVYHGSDYNFFPNAAALSNPFNQLYAVDADIHHELLTGSLSGGISDCGIELGFGTAAGHASAPLASNNLNVSGHTAGGDVVKFIHRFKDATENFAIDATINFASNGGFTGYGLAVWDSTFNMTKDSLPTAHGDYVDYHFRVTFDHVAKTATMTLTPTATSKTLSLMHAQTLTWNYQASSTATENGEARGGIEFSSGANPISISDFERSRASVGFIANGVARSCAYSNVALTLFKVAPSSP